MYLDARDEAVVEQLEEGAVYGVTKITNLYIAYTDITQERTAKERKNALMQTPAFENVAIGRFRYVGTGVDE